MVSSRSSSQIRLTSAMVSFLVSERVSKAVRPNKHNKVCHVLHMLAHKHTPKIDKEESHDRRGLRPSRKHQLKLYNSTGLLKNDNSTRPLENYNSTGPLENYNSTGPLKNYNSTRPLENYNSTGPLEN